MESLVDAETVPCIFIQDNPTFDALRSSLGLPGSTSSHGTRESGTSGQHALQVGCCLGALCSVW